MDETLDELGNYVGSKIAGALQAKVIAYGELTLDRGDRREVVLRAADYAGPGAAADLAGETFRGAFRDQLGSWTDAIAGGTPAPVTGRDGRMAVAMVLAAEASAASGSAVRIERSPSV